MAKRYLAFLGKNDYPGLPSDDCIGWFDDVESATAALVAASDRVDQWAELIDTEEGEFLLPGPAWDAAMRARFADAAAHNRSIKRPAPALVDDLMQVPSATVKVPGSSDS